MVGVFNIFLLITANSVHCQHLSFDVNKIFLILTELQKRRKDVFFVSINSLDSTLMFQARHL